MSAENAHLPPQFDVVVVGGVNIDLGGQPDSALLLRDSNPGRIRISPGGVGRNIAHNLRLLGLRVCFLTALGNDEYAQLIRRSCRELGIDLSHAVQSTERPTSAYLYINDSDGDMMAAVSDMSVCEEILPSYLSEQLPIINAAKLLVADANIPEESLVWLTEHCTVPLFVDPVSVSKAVKLKPILDRIHTLKPNRIEAELLAGRRSADSGGIGVLAEALLLSGVRRLFLSLGPEGVLAADRQEMLLFPCCPSSPCSTTGAGDAYMAALAYAQIEQMSLKEAACFASAAASLTVESPEAVNAALSVPAVYRRRELQPPCRTL